MDEHASDDWRDRAACRGEDPELFFPVGTSGPALEQIEAAKAVCHRCPVAAECLSWALKNGEAAGIWGGKTTEERRILSRHRASRVTGVVRRIVDETDTDDEDDWVSTRPSEPGRQGYAASAASTLQG